jgi:hypothetical protein
VTACWKVVRLGIYSADLSAVRWASKKAVT